MRRLLKALVWACALVILGALVFALTALEDAPLVADGPPPSPEDVAVSRSFVHDIRRAAQSGGAGDVVMVTEAQANSILRLARRVLQDVRGEVEVAPTHVAIRGSVPLPWPGGQKWINAEAQAPEFSGRASLDRVSVGPWPLPPRLVVEAGRIGANVVLGNRAGDLFLNSASALEIEGDEMRLSMRLDESGKQDFARGVFGTLRGSEMPEAQEIEREYRAVREAIDAGRLPTEGSFTPYIDFALGRVAARATEASLPNDFTAAIFGLAKACGLADFSLIVGRFAGEETADAVDWEKSCDRVTLAGRVDTRRHFIVAAAIQAASNRGLAVSMGEFKELYDTTFGNRLGFDFTDIAADNAGIRFSDLMMKGDVQDLETTRALVRSEADYLPDLSQIEGRMPRAEFEARFGSIDSPQYAAMIDRIEGQIGEVTIHRPRQ